MKYDLELFEEVISGRLSPFYEPANAADTYHDYLIEKYGYCYNIISARFKKACNKYVLVSKTVVNSLHHTVSGDLLKQQSLFQNSKEQQLPFDVYKLLGIKKHDVVAMVFTKQEGKPMLCIKQKVNCKTISHREARHYYYEDVLNEEVQRIKLKIKQTIFEYKTQKEIELYVHNLQQSLVSLCFQLLRHYSLEDQNAIYKPAEAYTEMDIWNICFISLETLLRFFEKNYLKYIDENVRIPYRSSLMKIYNIEGKLQVVKEAVLSSKISEPLLHIVYQPLLKINSIGADERLSYRQLIYSNTYLDAFCHHIKEFGSTFNEQQVLDILYRVNFNSPEMRQYKITVIKNSIATRDDLHDKVVHLYHWLKVINQRNCRVNVAYEPTLPSLKLGLTTWVEEEIHYLKVQLQPLNKTAAPDLFSDLDKAKLQSSFSVPQLALFYRLQLDAGIISAKTQIDVFKHIAESYKTSKADEISPDSIKNKFYNIDTNTIEVLKEKTILMLNNLKLLSTTV